MKNLITLFAVLFLLMTFYSFSQTQVAQQPAAQQPAATEPTFKWSGFVKTDIIFDTRQTNSLREGHFLLYPQNESLDINKKDINDKPNFNILSIQTRLNLNITGPYVLGAKTSAYIEGEYFGVADASINTFRLRHAFVDLKWEGTQLRVGQFWHPMFVTDCFPGVISFNTGAPFQPFSRNPQIRLTQSAGDFNFILAAMTQRDFSSMGPDGGSSNYLRNSVVPDMYFGIQFIQKTFLAGIGGEYKMLIPKLSVDGYIKPDTVWKKQTFVADEKIASYSGMGYLKIKPFEDFTIKLEGVYGQNLADQLMLGGYAVKTFDTTTGKETYTPINVLSAWGELVYGKNYELGLFVGFTKNLGADDNVVASYIKDKAKYFVRGDKIESMIRISPRFMCNVDKFKFGVEIEYTSAKFGTYTDNDKGIIKNTKDIANIRGLLAFYMFF